MISPPSLASCVFACSCKRGKPSLIRQQLEVGVVIFGAGHAAAANERGITSEIRLILRDLCRFRIGILQHALIIFLHRINVFSGLGEFCLGTVELNLEMVLA